MSIWQVLRPRNEDGTLSPIFGFLAVVLVVIGLVVFWIINYQQQLDLNQMTKIDNLGEYAKTMSRASRGAVERALYARIRENLAEGQRVPTGGAKVRLGTYAEQEEGEEIRGRFVVDIKSVRQSYQMSMIWSKYKNVDLGNYYVEVACVPDDLVIYDDFECKKLNTELPGEVGNPIGVLPYTKLNDETGEVAYDIRMMSDYLVISYQACGDEKLKKEYEQSARGWLKEQKVDFERYKLRFIDTCDGDF